jgi:sulfate permease, SulP family
MDATGILAIEELVRDFQHHGGAVLLVETRPNVRYKLERAGVIDKLGAENILATLDEALARQEPPRAAPTGLQGSFGFK